MTDRPPTDGEAPHPVVAIASPGRSTLHVVVHEALEVGRSCPGVLVDDPSVSRRHVELRPDGARILVRDLGSANGTLLDGAPIEGTVDLGPGRELRLGDTVIRLAAPSTSQATPVGAASSASAEMTSIERVAAAVGRDRPAGLSPHQGQTRTIAFSDIVDSTDLAVSMGDVAWFDLLEVHNSILRSCLGRHGGTEVKSQGDGFMLTFDSARQAVAYMVEMQQALAVDPLMRRHGLSVRVGAHTGEAVERDGDFFGQVVIAAARIGAAAGAGEILVSALIREIVESWGEVRFGRSRSIPLKGLQGQWTLHPVQWTGVDLETG